MELANRLAKGGFVRRRRHGDGTDKDKDRREVLLDITAKGEQALRELSLHHRAELRTAGPALMAALLRVLKAGKPRRFSHSTRFTVARK